MKMINFKQVLDMKYGLQPEDVDTIRELNNEVMCKLAPSKIHGVGVFAIRDIKKGEELGIFGSTNKRPYKLHDMSLLNPEVRELINQRWLLAEKGGVFQSPNDDARLISFMNHSENPNCDKETGKANRDIKKGEEITEDYDEFAKDL